MISVFTAIAAKKDYCTLFPDGNWGDCCKQHDEDYECHKVTGIKKLEADFYLYE